MSRSQLSVPAAGDPPAAPEVVGVIAMIDSEETDWKILAIALDDDRAPNIHDLADLDAHMPGSTAALTHWLRMYKTAEGKGENRFGFGGKPQGAAVATRIVEETHEAPPLGATPDRPRIDPGSTLDRPHVDLGSTPNRSDPTSTRQRLL